MQSMRFRLARWVIRHRLASLIGFVVVTAIFALGLRGVELKTVFSDLLPADDPYVQVFKEHPNFGNPLTMTIMVKRKSGDIYNADTLQKVWDLSRDIDLTPGVDHDQILSISTPKARYAEATPYGIDMQPLMGDSVPKTPEEIADLRRRVDMAPAARRFLISTDGTATLIRATFIERLLDYGVAFDYVNKLVEDARDENHEVYLAGQPALTGWVYEYESEMLGIFAITIAALIITLALYMRNVVGVVTPIITSAVASIWGFGLMGWLGSPIEPLLMVVPLLLVARSFSHCVQFIERYYEILAQVNDRKEAAEITMGVMMAPSILGIFTDVMGIFLIAVAPIPAMERFALFCGFWGLWLIPTGVFLIAIILSYLPVPKNTEQLAGASKDRGTGGIHHILRSLLGRAANIACGKPSRITLAIVIVGGAFAVYTAQQIKIGNPVEGSNLLWPDSEYNVAVQQINRHFPGVNTLEIVLEATTEDGDTALVAREYETYETMLELQALMEQGSAPPRATLSFADYMMEANRLFQGGDPRWLPIDPFNSATQAAASAAMMGSDPKAFSHAIDFMQRHSTVSLWYRDNKQETVDSALLAAEAAVKKVGVEHGSFRVLLGTGTIALQQAMNRVVERYEYVLILLLDLVILVGCSIAYRSIVAGLILLIPVNLANFILTAAMHMIGIGLDFNSLMVAVIGVGVGIDYGIYLLSRICEEFKACGDWTTAIQSSLMTTGKAIMFTATIMLLAILPWYFLSELKFTADMGLLLVVIMMINMILALIVLPLLVWWIKPRFAGRSDLLVGHEIDPDALRANRRAVGPEAELMSAT